MDIHLMVKKSLKRVLLSDIFKPLMKKTIPALALLILFIGVLYTQSFSSKVPYHFYHWQQTYNVPLTEKTPPKYIKILDINYHKTLEIQTTRFKVLPHQQIIPVIYLDNSVFLNLKSKTLAQKIFYLLEEQSRQKFAYHEVQFDCDWTAKTRANYFKFLKIFRQISAKELSATIRLHQVRYFEKTGVPPVDYGVLMYYNMSSFKDIETKNYILDLNVAQQYHQNFNHYPLKLNLALPLYAQATIERFGRVVGAMEGIRTQDLNQYFKALKNNHYKVTKTHYFHRRLLYKGDILRLDAVRSRDLKKAIERLKKVMPQPEEIIFYRWQNRDFYGEERLKNISTW